MVIVLSLLICVVIGLIFVITKQNKNIRKLEVDLHLLSDDYEILTNLAKVQKDQLAELRKSMNLHLKYSTQEYYEKFGTYEGFEKYYREMCEIYKFADFMRQ